MPKILDSPYKAMQVWKYRPGLLCKHLIFYHMLQEAMIRRDYQILHVIRSNVPLLRTISYCQKKYGKEIRDVHK